MRVIDKVHDVLDIDHYELLSGTDFIEETVLQSYEDLVKKVMSTKYLRNQVIRNTETSISFTLDCYDEVWKKVYIKAERKGDGFKLEIRDLIKAVSTESGVVYI